MQGREAGRQAQMCANAPHRCCAVNALLAWMIHGGAFVVDATTKMHTVGRVSGLRVVHIGMHERHTREAKADMK